MFCANCECSNFIETQTQTQNWVHRMPYQGRILYFVINSQKMSTNLMLAAVLIFTNRFFSHLLQSLLKLEVVRHHLQARKLMRRNEMLFELKLTHTRIRSQNVLNLPLCNKRISLKFFVLLRFSFRSRSFLCSSFV